jgi:hypothetical protein
MFWSKTKNDLHHKLRIIKNDSFSFRHTTIESFGQNIANNSPERVKTCLNPDHDTNKGT